VSHAASAIATGDTVADDREEADLAARLVDRGTDPSEVVGEVDDRDHE
jgi:hypothetical protein